MFLNLPENELSIKNKTLLDQGFVLIYSVRAKGLEPSHREALDPKSSVSTNFTTSAKPINCPVEQIGAQRYKRIEK